MPEQPIPAEVFHPADFVEEELEARGWTLERLAIEMGGDFCRNLCMLEFLLLRESRLRMGELCDDLARSAHPRTCGGTWRHNGYARRKRTDA